MSGYGCRTTLGPGSRAEIGSAVRSNDPGPRLAGMTVGERGAAATPIRTGQFVGKVTYHSTFVIPGERSMQSMAPP
jgi:hypothetical protein